MAPILAIGVLGTTACDSLLGLFDQVPVTVAFAVPTPVGASPMELPAGVRAVVIEGGGSVLDLQTAEVTLDELVIERAEGAFGGDSDGDSDSDSDSDGGSSEKITVGATTFALPLEGGTITPISQSIPAGVYEEVELDVASIRLVGTWDGEAFDVVVPLDEEFEFEFEPPVEIDGTTEDLSITVSLDVASWFTNADGTLIDPRALGTDPVLRAAFVDRVEAALEAAVESSGGVEGEDSDGDSDSDSG